MSLGRADMLCPTSAVRKVPITEVTVYYSIQPVASALAQIGEPFFLARSAIDV